MQGMCINVVLFKVKHCKVVCKIWSLMAVTIKIVAWDLMLCVLVAICQHFVGG